MLLLYTDGITDAYNRKNVTFGYDGLAKTVAQITNPSAPVICDELIKAASKHQAGSLQFDDMTIVVIRAIWMGGDTTLFKLHYNVNIRT